MWDALRERFEGNEQLRNNKRQFPTNEFDVFMHYKNETLDQVISRFCHLLATMDDYGIYPELEEKKEKLLDALPPEWENYITVIKENEESFRVLTVNGLIGKLQAQELVMQKKRFSSSSPQHICSILHGTEEMCLNQAILVYLLHFSRDNNHRISKVKICIWEFHRIKTVSLSGQMPQLVIKLSMRQILKETTR